VAASPCPAKFYEIWHTRSTYRQIITRVKFFVNRFRGYNLQSSDTPWFSEIAISHWLAMSPLQQCCYSISAPQIQLWCWHCAPYKCSYYYYYYRSTMQALLCFGFGSVNIQWEEFHFPCKPQRQCKYCLQTKPFMDKKIQAWSIFYPVY